MSNPITEWWNRTRATSRASNAEEDEVLLPPGFTADEGATNETGGDRAANDQGTETRPGGNNVPEGTQTNTPPAANGQNGQQEHPIVAAATAAGITTVAQFEALASRAVDGDKFRTNATDTFQKAAIRLYGQESGMARVASYKHLSAEEKIELAAGYNADANAKYGIGKDSTTGGAARQTTSGEQKESVNAEQGGGGDSAKSAWDKLTPAQQAHGTAMGYKTPEARERFAVEALKTLGKDTE